MTGTPDPALIRQREELVQAIDDLVDRDAAQRARAYDDPGGDPGLYHRLQEPQNEAAIDAAEAELDAFDAGHPDVTAWLGREDEAAHQHFMDTD